VKSEPPTEEEMDSTLLEGSAAGRMALSLFAEKLTIPQIDSKSKINLEKNLDFLAQSSCRSPFEFRDRD